MTLRLLIYIVLCISSALALLIFNDPVMVGLLTGVSTALLIPIIDMILNHPYGIRFLYQSFKLRNQPVRISASYLIRIEHRGRYLLIRGNRYPDQFQPVGGVYKFNPSALSVLRKLRVQSDDLIPIDDVSSDDLRIRVEGRFLPSFLRWFVSGEGRENGPFREFYEELVLEGPLPSKFANIRFDFVRRHVNPIRYSPYAQSHELLVADIYEAVVDDVTRREIEALTEANPESFLWLSADRIRRRGAVPGEAQTIKVASTCEWIL